jgi:hypothetical protein
MTQMSKSSSSPTSDMRDEYPTVTQSDFDRAAFRVGLKPQQPDRFFSAAQQKRLAELMEKWRLARDEEAPFSAEELSELDALVEAELRASAHRAATLINELRE